MRRRKPATLSAQRRRYRMRHGEAVRARIAYWRREHPDANRTYLRANSGELNLARRGRYTSDEPYRARTQLRNGFARAYWQSRAFAVIAEQTCARCGCDDLRILDVNHKTGTPKIGAMRSGLALWKAIATGRVDARGFNLLCKVCNIAEYVERTWPGLVGACTVRWDIPFSLALLESPLREVPV